VRILYFSEGRYGRKHASINELTASGGQRSGTMKSEIITLKKYDNGI